MDHRRGALVIAIVVVALGLGACGGSTTHPGTGTVSGHGVVYTFGVAGTMGKVVQTEHKTPTPISGIPGTVVQIATSNSNTYALTSSGTVWAWGVGSNDELGNGSKPAYSLHAVEVDFPSGVRIAVLANPMPFDGGLAIDSQGDAWGWGFNAFHDLCLPEGLVVPTPARIPLGDVTLATGARTHSLIDSQGTVYACGDGEYGELGNATTADRATPTPVVGLPPGTVRALTSSWGGSGALMSNGSYYDWGYGVAGQLGDGTDQNSPVPVAVSLPAAAVHVFQGGSGAKNGQSIAVLADGSLWTWGNGTSGQLGNGGKADSSTPVHITLPMGAVAAGVASGGYASYAIDTSGQLWAWGRNDDGQLGTGGRGPSQLTPTATGLSVDQISSTAQNAAALSK